MTVFQTTQKYLKLMYYGGFIFAVFILSMIMFTFHISIE